MRVISNLEELHPDQAGDIAFVPTMGALHAGHAQLIARARELSQHVLVSAFINPLQFNDPEDLERYPRNSQSDALVAEESGATILWRPEVEEIYPGDIEMISAGTLGNLFEGVTRKGHFDGMLTVVNRLFTMVAPKWAIFGEKDFQQLFLVRQMVEEQGRGIKILSVPTVRDGDGLALSSRNVQMSEDERSASLVIYRALFRASKTLSLSEMRKELDKTLAEEPRFRCDYSAIIDEENFALATEETWSKRALVAGWVGGLRLIDNMKLRN